MMFLILKRTFECQTIFIIPYSVIFNCPDKLSINYLPLYLVQELTLYASLERKKTRIARSVEVLVKR